MDSKKELARLQIDIDSIPDQNTRIIIRHLLNIVESLSAENQKLREENQKLRDEVNHLKGEQGQPKIRKQSQSNKNLSSESERKNRNGEKQRKNKKSKKEKLIVHQTERRFIDPGQLPSDAEFKGYHSTIIQDIVIMPHNIQFDREMGRLTYPAESFVRYTSFNDNIFPMSKCMPPIA